MSPLWFRILVVTSLLLGNVSALLEPLFPRFVNSELVPIIKDASATQVAAHISLSAIYLFVLTSAVSAVGLLLFRRWARTLALYSTIFGLLLVPFLISVEFKTAISSSLTVASDLLWGAVLALAYFSPLRRRFKPHER